MVEKRGERGGGKQEKMGEMEGKWRREEGMKGVID